MKKILLLIAASFIYFFVAAQQNYFVYLQTDNKQPFYVKINDKLLSSSASGYLVIPKLTEGNYPITVGFPKDQWAAQLFNLQIDKTDMGYILKNLNEKGWGLYNIQTMEITMSGGQNKIKPLKDDDAFANTISGVTNRAIKPIEKTETARIIIPAVNRLNNKNTNEGNYSLYAINENNITDTIDVFIPNLNVVDKTKAINKSEDSIAQGEIKEPVKVEEPSKLESKKIKVSKKEVKATEPTKEMKASKEESIKEPTQIITTEMPKNINQSKIENAPVLSFNSDCKSTATDDDFFKTRKKIVAENNDDQMIETAKKLFKQKCYSTEQIKNLSYLFLNNNAKYKFFDAAYPFVYDTQKFSSLQNQLNDEYYINRFKAMLRN